MTTHAPAPRGRHPVDAEEPVSAMVAQQDGTPATSPNSTPVPASRRRRWQHTEKALAVAMSLPAVLPFLAFSVVPILYIIYLSFTAYDGITTPTWVGLANYQTLIQDGSWWESVKNTLILAAGQIVVEIPLALLLAVILNRRVRARSTFIAVYFLPHVMSIAVMGVVFYFLFRPISGVINGWLQTVGLISTEVDWLGSGPTAMASIITVAVWAGFGINTVFFLVGMQTIPRDVYESAAIDGATGWQQFRRITLPLLGPMMRVVMMLTIVFALRSFDLIKTLTDGGPVGETNVMFTYLFDYFFSFDRATQYGYGSALGVGASIIIAIVSGIYLYFSRNQGDTGGGSAR